MLRSGPTPEWHARPCVCVDRLARCFKVSLFPTHAGSFEFTARVCNGAHEVVGWAGGFGGNATVAVLPPLALPLVPNTPAQVRRLGLWVLLFMHQFGAELEGDTTSRPGVRHGGQPRPSSAALTSYVAGSLAFLVQRVVSCTDAAAMGLCQLFVLSSWRTNRSNLTRCLGWLMGGPFVAKQVVQALEDGDVASFPHRQAAAAAICLSPPHGLGLATKQPRAAPAPPSSPAPCLRPAPPRPHARHAARADGLYGSPPRPFSEGTGRPRRRSRESLRVTVRQSPRSDRGRGDAACATALLGLLDLACWCCEPESQVFFHAFGEPVRAPTAAPATHGFLPLSGGGSGGGDASGVGAGVGGGDGAAGGVPGSGTRAHAHAHAHPRRHHHDVASGMRSSLAAEPQTMWGSRESKAIAASHSAATLRRSLSQCSMSSGDGSAVSPSPLQPTSIPMELLLDVVAYCAPGDVSSSFVYQTVENMSWARVRTPGSQLHWTKSGSYSVCGVATACTFASQA